jgi:hypothetical protein
MTIAGLNEFTKKLDELAKKAEQLNGTNNVPFSELFNKEFMQLNTKYTSIESMFESSGYNITSKEDFLAIPDAEWDSFVVKSTNFASWVDMQKSATAEYVKKRLGF